MPWVELLLALEPFVPELDLIGELGVLLRFGTDRTEHLARLGLAAQDQVRRHRVHAQLHDVRTLFQSRYHRARRIQHRACNRLAGRVSAWRVIIDSIDRARLEGRSAGTAGGGADVAVDDGTVAVASGRRGRDSAARRRRVRLGRATDGGGGTVVSARGATPTAAGGALGAAATP